MSAHSDRAGTETDRPPAAILQGPANIVPHLAFGVPTPTIRSRRLLVETLQLLTPFREALTVIGAHAVMWHAERVGHVPDATAGADTALDPKFIATTPSIIEILNQAGLEQAAPNRPGIYGYQGEGHLPQKQRTTVDLLVPDEYAGAGRRSARVPGQKDAMTRARGIELTLYDNHWTSISTLPGDTEPITAEARVGGAGALLVAKAHKVRDRLAHIDTHPERLRPKDSADVGLLMLASDPAEVADRTHRVIQAHPETLQIACDGFNFLTSMYRSDAADLTVYHDLVSGLERDFPDVGDQVQAWIGAFTEQATWRR